LAAAGAILSAASPASAAFTINWATLNGASTTAPLVVPTTDGNTATFTSTINPNNAGISAGTFNVANTGLFDGFTYGLGDTLSYYGDTLTITFANAIAGSVSFAFGIEDLFGGYGNDFLTVSSNTGVTAIAATALDSNLFSEPEGNAYIDAPGATVLTITSGIPNTTNSNPFEIGNVNVPEPISLTILGVGVAGLIAARRRGI
jgi:hypothetical protein